MRKPDIRIDDRQGVLQLLRRARSKIWDWETWTQHALYRDIEGYECRLERAEFYCAEGACTAAMVELRPSHRNHGQTAHLLDFAANEIAREIAERNPYVKRQLAYDNGKLMKIGLEWINDHSHEDEEKAHENVVDMFDRAINLAKQL